MTSLHNKSLERSGGDFPSNMSTISSTGSMSSLSSLRMKRRAPAPPKKSTVAQISIPEETPSMVYIEESSRPVLPDKTSTLRSFQKEPNRVLPDLPIRKMPDQKLKRQQEVVDEKTPSPRLEKVTHLPPPLPVKPPPYSSSSELPEPAPRVSLLKEAKIDVESPRKHKKSAKKHKKDKQPKTDQIIENVNPRQPSHQPVQTSVDKYNEELAEDNNNKKVPIEVVVDQSSAKTQLVVGGSHERSLSPDSALASSESSSGTSSRKVNPGKVYQQLIRISPYEPFKPPVVLKSSNIKEKIAMFSSGNTETGLTGGYAKPRHIFKKKTPIAMVNPTKKVVVSESVMKNVPPLMQELQTKTNSILSLQKSVADFETILGCSSVSDLARNFSLNSTVVVPKKISTYAPLPKIRLTSPRLKDHSITLVKDIKINSKQVEQFAKLIHERNAKFVTHCRSIKGSLGRTGQSSYFYQKDLNQAQRSNIKILSPQKENLEDILSQTSVSDLARNFSLNSTVVVPKILKTMPKIRLISPSFEDDANKLILKDPKIISKQVEQFAKLIHERNNQFVTYCRGIKGSLARTGESSYFYQEDLNEALKLSKVDTIEKDDANLVQVNDVVKSPDHVQVSPEHVQMSPSRKKLHKRSMSVDEHAKWNTFLKDISQMTIEIDDDGLESFL
jgi:outer membrane lipoprotein-sorting protein